MADTGAPWNLPYPLPTDLVRDGADAIKDLAEATADGLDAAGGLVQVRFGIKTDADAFAVADRATETIDGLTVSITPQNADNRIVVFGSVSIAVNDADSGGLILTRNGATTDYLGDARGVRRRASAPFLGNRNLRSLRLSPSNLMFVDTPETTSELVYGVDVQLDRGSSTTVYINRTEDDANSETVMTYASVLVAMEVKV